MLGLVHVVALAGIGPIRLARDARQRTSSDGARSLRAENVIGVLVIATFDLAAAEESAHVIRIKIIHLEVIVDVAALGRNLAAPTATQLMGGLSPIAQAILSALCTACSTNPSPHR